MAFNRIAKSERDLRWLSEASAFGMMGASNLRVSVLVADDQVEDGSLIKRPSIAFLLVESGTYTIGVEERG